MISESPIEAIIVDRFDLGFILRHPDGRLGQLRVPEMSPQTAEQDRTSETGSVLGTRLKVYIMQEVNGQYLFSEFSSAEREERDRLKDLRVALQAQAEVGQKLSVTIENKLAWGCICREVSGHLEGVIPAPSTVTQKKWPEPELQMTEAEWQSLTVGARVHVIIVRKEWAH